MFCLGNILMYSNQRCALVIGTDEQKIYCLYMKWCMSDFLSVNSYQKKDLLHLWIIRFFMPGLLTCKILNSIGEIRSDHGRNILRSSGIL